MGRSNRYLPLLGRTLIGVTFIYSGIAGLAAHAAAAGYINGGGPTLAQLAWRITIAVELVGGMLLLIGYRARLTAAVLAGFVLATPLIFQQNFGDPNEISHLLTRLMLVGGLLQIVYFGAGPLSLDAAGPLLLPRHGQTDRVDFTTL
jgi:putative oxidoreductase